MIGERQTPQMRERNLEIMEMRKTGMTLKAIGQKYGIRAETVRQILLRQQRIEEKRQRGRKWRTGQCTEN